MPKLPFLSPEKHARVLERKGFVLDRIKGSHAYFHPDLDVTITIPFHKKEVGKGLLIEIRADKMRSSFSFPKKHVVPKKHTGMWIDEESDQVNGQNFFMDLC